MIKNGFPNSVGEWMVLLKKIFPSIVVILFFYGILAFFFYNLTLFNFKVFDENYYAVSASSLFYGQEDKNFQHPELAKFLISIPFHFIGVWPFAWRLMPVLFGFGGVVVTYFFARRLGMSRSESMMASLCLIGTGSWYVLSRLAMLDIFVSVFVLLGGFSLYLFLSKNDFGREIRNYRYKYYFWLFVVFTGLAGACKLSGFFPYLFLFGYLLFYIRSSRLVRTWLFVGGVIGSILVYSLVNLAILRFNTQDFWARNVKSVVFHNSEMLPSSYQEAAEKSGISDDLTKHLTSGYKGFFRFIFQNEVFYFKPISSVYKLKGYALSNNQFMATGLFIGLVLSFLSLLGKVVRIRQGMKGVDSFPLIEDPRYVYLLLFGFCMVIPWAFIPRVQFPFYYVPAFPFITLWACLFLFKHVDKRLVYGLLTAYFLYTSYAMRYWVPLI